MKKTRWQRDEKEGLAKKEEKRGGQMVRKKKKTILQERGSPEQPVYHNKRKKNEVNEKGVERREQDPLNQKGGWAKKSRESNWNKKPKGKREKNEWQEVKPKRKKE